MDIIITDDRITHGRATDSRSPVLALGWNTDSMSVFAYLPMAKNALKMLRRPGWTKDPGLKDFQAVRIPTQ